MQSNTPNVQLTNQERGYYSSILSQVDPQESSRIAGKDAAIYFKQSGLSKEQLQHIWILSSSSKTDLTRAEFYLALKLISYAQNNISVDLETVSRNIISPLPKFQTQSQESPQKIEKSIINLSITEDKKLIYKKYFMQSDEGNKGFLTRNEADFYLQKSQLPSNVQKEIWNLIDTNNYNCLNEGQFGAALHLMVFVRQGMAVPQILPFELQDHINQYPTQFQYNYNQQQNFSIAKQLSSSTNNSNTELDIVHKLTQNEPKNFEQSSINLMSSNPNLINQNIQSINISSSQDSIQQQYLEQQQQNKWQQNIQQEQQENYQQNTFLQQTNNQQQNINYQQQIKINQNEQIKMNFEKQNDYQNNQIDQNKNINLLLSQITNEQQKMFSMSQTLNQNSNDYYEIIIKLESLLSKLKSDNQKINDQIVELEKTKNLSIQKISGLMINIQNEIKIQSESIDSYAQKSKNAIQDISELSQTNLNLMKIQLNEFTQQNNFQNFQSPNQQTIAEQNGFNIDNFNF